MAIVEIAVSMQNSPNPLGKRIGSIVVARRPLGEIGTLERERYLWLLVEAPDEADLLALASPRYHDPDTQLIITQKFRFEYPIEALASRVPGFDTLRALAPRERYQPFIAVDERTGRFTPRRGPESATPVRERGV